MTKRTQKYVDMIAYMSSQILTIFSQNTISDSVMIIN